MRLRTRYPALVRGKVRRMTGSRLMLVVPEIEVEVPEVEASDAPLALVVTRNGETTPYRAHGGRLYVPFKDTFGKSKDMDIASLAFTENTTIFQDTHPLFGGVMSEIKDFLGHTRAASETRPERLYSLLQQRHGVDHAVLTRALLDANALEENEQTAADMKRWENRAREIVGGLLSIEGKFWQAEPEPCYQLFMTSSTVDVMAADYFHASVRNGLYSFEWTSLSNRYFSALDRDLLVQAGGEDDESTSIEVLLPEVLTANIRDIEVHRFAERGLANFEEYVGRKSKRDPAFFRRIPSELLLRAAELRDTVAKRDVCDPVDEELARRLETFSECLAHYPSIVEGMDFDEISEIAHILEVWNDREIVVTAGNDADIHPSR